MPSPRSKIPGTPWWCVEDLESVKKAVEQNNRSIEKLDASVITFQKQHQDSYSSLHARCASLEAHYEQLSVSVQKVVRLSPVQKLHQEQTFQLDQMQSFEQTRQERDSDITEFNERLERLESKLDQSLSAAVDADTASDTKVQTKDAAAALEGTLAMLFNVQGSLEQTHQAIAAACTKGQRKELVAKTAVMAAAPCKEPIANTSVMAMSQDERTRSTPSVQRCVSLSGSQRDSSRGLTGGTSACLIRAATLKKMPSHKAPLVRSLQQPVQKALTRCR